MDPKEFSWSEDQTVTVTNPTSKAFEFKVHNKDYVVQSGRTAKMPGFIAWNYVYGLASLLCQADGKWARWNEEGFRKQYYDQVVAGTDDVVQQVVESTPKDTTDLTEKEPSEPVQTGATRGRPPKN